MTPRQRHQQAAAAHPATDAPSWFAGRIPDGWFSAPPSVSFDADEILVVGLIADVDLAAAATDAERGSAREARVSRFREETRAQRMRIADEAQHRFGRVVSWGVEIAGERRLFTTVSAPVMTRLRLGERSVLDTLIDAGVARSRSEALAWCVRLVGRNEDTWLRQLREAMSAVERVRDEGPEVA